MNPSGNLTNSTCGGVSTGEPYREVCLVVLVPKPFADHGGRL